MSTSKNDQVIEQRSHRRLDLQLPLEYHHISAGRCNVGRSTTGNISTGGVYFETTADNIHAGDHLALEISISGDEKLFPANSRFATTATVLRSAKVNLSSSDGHPSFTRYCIAAKFAKNFTLTT
ncbi:MAG: PilZ domain-containing protein [Phycisphaerae bacterium]|nr:PilZ domain-containing protein [Phycisphaerae bacterium]